MASTAPELDTATAVLAVGARTQATADPRGSPVLALAVDWAAMHSVDSLDDAACDWYGNQPVPVSGDGAPLVAEFCIAEFATAVGLSAEAGKAYVGEAVELRHRLPKTWTRVIAGDLPPGRRGGSPRGTIALTREAAAFVDAATAPFAHKTRPAELERTIATAIATFMPQEAEARRLAAADGRRFEIDTRGHHLNGLHGTADVYGTLDLADALDLEAAVASTAATLKDLGSPDSLDVRRAVAVGEIARRQLTLDLTGSRPGGRGRRRPGPAGRWSSTSTCPTPPSPAPAGWAPGQPQPRRPRPPDQLLVRQRRRRSR